MDQIIIKNRDYKSELLIYHQKKYSKIKFKTLKDNEFKNGIQFISSVICNEKTIGIGKGSSKKIAEQEASKNALI